MKNHESRSWTPTRWETFRFSVVGPLLAAPPQRGELHEAIAALACKTWRHPITGEGVHFGFATIERWFYKAKAARVDPVGALVRKVRSDYGTQPAMPEDLRGKLREQYRDHPSWSYKLHADNLEVTATDELKLEVRRRIRRCGASCRKPGYASDDAVVHVTATALGQHGPRHASRHARSAATSRPTSTPCGMLTSITVAARCYSPMAHGSNRCCWASSTIARDCAATCNGTCARRQKTSSMVCRRRCSSAGCPGRC